MSRDRIQELQQPRNYSSSNNSRDSTNRPIEMSARSNAPANDFAGEVRLLTQLDKATRYTSSIDRKIDQIASLHERALVAVGQDEINRTTAQVDALQAETNQMMDKVRRCLSNLSNETNRMRGNQVNARKAQQATVARKLMDVARKYEKVQQKYKLKYQQRITREIRIARPDASVEEVNYALQSGNTAVFAQEMIQGRSGDQRRVLEQVQTRHDELMKIEQSVEQLATLFQDMQVLLEVF